MARPCQMGLSTEPRRAGLPVLPEADDSYERLARKSALGRVTKERARVEVDVGWGRATDRPPNQATNNVDPFATKA
jgi:hypothetical protein